MLVGLEQFDASVKTWFGNVRQAAQEAAAQRQAAVELVLSVVVVLRVETEARVPLLAFLEVQ